MKICKNCGQKLHENTQLCPDCGGVEFDVTDGDIYDHQINNNVITTSDMAVNGNIFLGVLGAFLLSLTGGLLYFALYQFGIVSGLCGFAIFYLSSWGYKKFSKCNNGISTAGLVTSIVMMITIIFIAHYVSYAFSIYQVYEEGFVSFFDVLLSIPEYLQDSETLMYFLEDLIFAYVFGFIGVIGDIVRIRRIRK